MLGALACATETVAPPNARCHHCQCMWCYGQVGAPPLAKRVDAELGCVTPYIVVPGAWTEADMEYYADEVVAGLVNNAGHNCTKAELLVTSAEWPLRDALVAAVRCAPSRPCLAGRLHCVVEFQASSERLRRDALVPAMRCAPPRACRASQQRSMQVRKQGRCAGQCWSLWCFS